MKEKDVDRRVLGGGRSACCVTTPSSLTFTRGENEKNLKINEQTKMAGISL